jgi:hypothetical protein
LECEDFPFQGFVAFFCYIKTMKKIWGILISISVLAGAGGQSAATTSIKEGVNVNYQGYQVNAASTTTDQNDFMWSGMALQYYLYVNSSVYSNHENSMVELIDMLADRDDLLEKLNITSGELNPNNKTDIYFLMSQVSSIICLSEYGLSSYQEFFAECFSKWQTTPDSMKNKSWELLNNFFLHIYPYLKDNFSGAMTEERKTQLFDYIQSERVSNSLIYEIDLDTKPTDLTYRDLDYTDTTLGFNFKQGEKWDKSAVTKYEIISNVAAVYHWAQAGDLGGVANLDNDNNYMDWITEFNIDKGDSEFSDVFNAANHWTYDSLTKASDASKKEFNDYLAKTKEDYYPTFDALDADLAKWTTTNKGYATIDLKNTIDDMAESYRWSDTKTATLKEQILDMFDVAYGITKWGETDALKYFLTGIIFSPDYPLAGTSAGVMAYTSSSFYNSGSELTSTAFAQIIYTGQSMNLFADETKNNQYQAYWWSSPNIFATLNHEFGHVIDSYIGFTNGALNQNEGFFKDLISDYSVYDAYTGNTFGVFDQHVAPKNGINPINLFFYILIGIAGAAGIAAILAYVIIRRKRAKA